MIWITLKDFMKLRDKYLGYIVRHKGQLFQCIVLCCNEVETIEVLCHEMVHGILWDIGENKASDSYDNVCDLIEE